MTLVLQSEEGLLDGDLAAGDNPVASEQARKALEVLSRIAGRKSDGFKRLVGQLSHQGRSN